MLSDFRLYYKANVIKTAHWHKNRNTGQYHWTEIPEVYPLTYSHLTYDKEAKNIQCRKHIHTHTHKVVWENWTAMYTTMKLEFYNPIYKWSKCIKDLI